MRPSRGATSQRRRKITIAADPLTSGSTRGQTL
jgi:hypothetical protein